MHTKELLGKTVIAGNRRIESFECVEIVYEGAIEKWKQIPKGSRYWVDDIDMWGAYFYHNDEGSYRLIKNTFLGLLAIRR